MTARRFLSLLLVLWGLAHMVEQLVATLALWSQLDHDSWDGTYAFDAYLQTLWHRQLVRGLAGSILAALFVLRGPAVARALLPATTPGGRSMRPWVEVGLAFAGLHLTTLAALNLLGVALFAHAGDMWEFSVEPVDEPLVPYLLPLVAALIVMLLPRLGRALLPLRVQHDEASA